MRKSRKIHAKPHTLRKAVHKRAQNPYKLRKAKYIAQRRTQTCAKAVQPTQRRIQICNQSATDAFLQIKKYILSVMGRIKKDKSPRVNRDWKKARKLNVPIIL